MATKLEIDIEEHRIDNSSGDGELIGMVDEGSYGSVEDKSNTQYLDTAEDDSPYNFKDLSTNGVTYRFVHVEPEDTATHPVEGTNVVPPGQFYVIGNPNEMFSPAHKAILPRDSGATKNIKKRDDKRRATHNEVERRRRDKINSWITKLAGLVPGTAGQPTDAQSKGGILAKACDYITDLTAEQARCHKCLRENEKLVLEVMKLKKELAEAWKENAVLKYQLSEQSVAPRAVSKS